MEMQLGRRGTVKSALCHFIYIYMPDVGDYPFFLRSGMVDVFNEVTQANCVTNSSHKFKKVTYGPDCSVVLPCREK